MDTLIPYRISWSTIGSGSLAFQADNTGKALDIVRIARDMHVCNAIVDEYHVIRQVVNLETINRLEGTHDIHALFQDSGQTVMQPFTGA